MAVARYACNNPPKVVPYWRAVVIRWIQPKRMTLGLVYRRMGWSVWRQWAIRRRKDMNLSEAGRLAMACEAPLGPFLQDLVVAMGLQPVGDQQMTPVAKIAQAHYYPRGRCGLCGSTRHRVKKCPRLVSPRAAMNVLKADHLALAGVLRSARRQALKRAAK